MLDEIAVSRFVFQPGWRWETDVGPIAGTETCQHRHVGYTISGSLTVRMNDGTTLTIGPGEAYEIPAGHLAWVEGDVPWESVEFTSGHAFAKSPEALGERVLATIVFTDICDSTAILARVGDAEWARIVREHNARIRTVIDRFRGRELATLGDGFLAVFDGAAKAVMAAAAMDPAVAELGVHVRAGVQHGRGGDRRRASARRRRARGGARRGARGSGRGGRVRHDPRPARRLGARVHVARQPRAEGLGRGAPDVHARSLELTGRRREKAS